MISDSPPERTYEWSIEVALKEHLSISIKYLIF